MRKRSIFARRPRVSIADLPALPIEALERRTLLSATLTTLVTFNNTNGANPTGGLTADGAGNLFGTTLQGGSTSQGTIYKLAAGTNALTTLASFNDNTGIQPRGTPAVDSAGNLFGSASSGANPAGTVFELPAGGSLLALANFINVNGSNPVLDGAFPQAGVIADSQGNLYGTTVSGGANAVGTLYETTPTGTIIPLVQFDGANGRSPRGDLVDVSGVLFGTTTNGGATDLGTVFSYNIATTVFTTIAQFNGTNGSNPKGGVVFDAAGNMYGTTSAGGPADDGTVFEVSTAGVITTLATFNGANGSTPLNDLSIDSSGNLFGTTSTAGASGDGTVFEIDAATHTLTTLISFSGANGISPQGNLHLDPAGNIYGTTLNGGANNDGTVFELTNSIVPNPPTAPPPEHIGGLDPNFGVNGLASHSIGFNSTEGVALDGTQSVIVGTIGTSPHESFGVTRYNANGSLDTSFGSGGVVATSIAQTDAVPNAVVVLPNGNILVAGTATTFTSGVASGSEFAIAEYTSAGSPDTSFGNGTGQVLLSFSNTAGSLSNDLLHAMDVSAAGTIYVAGSSDASGSGRDFAVAALNADGSPATGFHGNGKLLIDFSGSDDSAGAIAVQPNGEVVVAGSTGGDSSIAITRLLASGASDSHFGTKGSTIASSRGARDEATSVAIGPKGVIAVGGASITGSASDGSLNSNFLVVQFASTGKIDPTFGHGPVITGFGQPAAVTGVLYQANGQIVASGKSTPSLSAIVPGELEIAIARYTTKGALDASFNGTGKAIFSLAGIQPTFAPAFARAFSIVPLDVTSDLNAELNELIASGQGALTSNNAGELLIVGNNDTDTIEGEVITAGIDLLTKVLGALPPAVIGGAKGTTTVAITETGTSAADGNVTIDLAVGPNADGTGSSFIHKFAEKISLKQSKGKTFKLNFNFPSSLADGNYFLLATVDTGAVKDLNTINNTAASSAPVKIAAPFVDLAGGNLVLAAAAVNKPSQVSFNIANIGNETATGKISVEFFASVDKTLAAATVLVTLPGISLNLKPRATKPFHERLTIPTTLPSGTYFLLALLDSTGKYNDPTSANNLIATNKAFTR